MGTPTKETKDAKGNEVPAQTSTLDQVNKSIDITFNTSMLPGTSPIFQQFTILHEFMHAYIQTTGYYPSHEQMLQGGISPNGNLMLLYNEVRDLGFTRRQTFAIILYGSKDAEDTGTYESVINTYNGLTDRNDLPLSKADVLAIGASFSNGIINSQRKLTSLGGPNCK